MSNLNKQIVTATKWSSVTEIAAKIVSPISTIVLARLLTPEAFGVLVTATMVISFAEIFTDAGFQKYLIQHQFASSEALYKSTNVAFWSNLTLSVLIWIAIILFAGNLATLVGNEGRGDVIAVSCFCIPLAAFSSIQMALYKRDFDFKTLFMVRIVGVLIPIVITIPLAYFTRSYWSLIIGMIALNISNAVLLSIKSKWKPRWFYSFRLLKDMLSFTIWSMLESVAIWLTGYIDVFIVGTMLNQHYLGVYRTSITTVGQIMGLITAATTPVLFSALSKLQNDNDTLVRMFLSFQKFVGILVIPLGAFIYLFRDLLTDFLLGGQWYEAANFIGLWGLTSSITIVFAHYCSEMFRAKGKPKLSVLAQALHMFFLVPAVMVSIKYGFDVLCEVRAWVRLTSIFVNASILYWLLHIGFLKMLRNTAPALLAAIVMAVIVTVASSYWGKGLCQQIVMMAVAGFCYVGVLMLFPKERTIMCNLKKYLKQ